VAIWGMSWTSSWTYPSPEGGSGGGRVARGAGRGARGADSGHGHGSRSRRIGLGNGLGARRWGSGSMVGLDGDVITGGIAGRRFPSKAVCSGVSPVILSMRAREVRHGLRRAGGLEARWFGAARGRG
jgi:hypothetical protein